MGYRVKYWRPDLPSSALAHVISDRLERELTIEELEEWTEYEVQIQAFNAIGAGPWSEVVHGRTRESGEVGPCGPGRACPREGAQAHRSRPLRGSALLCRVGMVLAQESGQPPVIYVKPSAPWAPHGNPDGFHSTGAGLLLL